MKELEKEIVKYLMDSQTTEKTAVRDCYNRRLIVTVCNAYYSKPSTLLFEVEGSPVRGRAVLSCSSYISFPLNSKFFEWKISIETPKGWKTLPYTTYIGGCYGEIDLSESWTSKFVRFAEFVFTNGEKPQ
jgi:hypothetical protein